MSWEEFVARVNGLVSEGEAPWEVEWDPNRERPGEREVLIGLGVEGDQEVERESQSVGIALQPLRSGYRSVTAMVKGVSAGTVSDWQRRLGSSESLEGCGMTVVVEDLSPDTCLGFLFFLARVAGIPAEELPQEWADYVAAWESGDVHTTGRPYASWGCLHSSLGHSFFGSRLGMKGQEKDTLPAIKEGFRVCLRYLTDLIRWRIPPREIPERLSSMEHARARWHLKQEECAYRQSLQQAICLQLVLPLQGSDRLALVDAYVTTETQPSGAKKAFLRQDREHTWLGEGFALMGVYRPAALGTGNDVTVSVDPATGLHLRDLWAALEEREEARWQEADAKRPRDKPRPIDSYPEGGPNEPWWDDYGNYTLVAAPRRLADGRLGSRLRWKEDVLETIWGLYNPGLILKVTSVDAPQEPAQYLHEIAPAHERAGKRVVMAQWDPLSTGELVASPTIQRYMAACAKAPHADGVPLAELPEVGTFELLYLPGAMVVIHQDGMVILDDWTDEQLDLDACLNEIRSVTDRLESFHEIYSEVQTELDEVDQVIKGGSRGGFLHATNRLSEIKAKLRIKLVATRTQTGSSHVAHLRDRLQDWWAVGRRLEELNDVAAQLESLIQNHIEVRTNRLISGLTVYGFPAVVFGGLLETVFSDVPADGPLQGINWVVLSLYVVLVFLGVGFLHIGTKRLYAASRGAKPVREDPGG